MPNFIRIICMLSFLLGLISCAAINISHIPAKTQKIMHRASEEHFIASTVSTHTFNLTVLRKNLAPDNPETHVYIEGDGRSWKTRYKLSDNPTPRQPLALQLAMQDPHPNVMYIARPCQYTPLCDDTFCEPKFWSSHRYAPEVITAVNDVLDNFKLGPRFRGDDDRKIGDDKISSRLPRESGDPETKFVLIGFSGGASVATLVASQRNDVSQLITVAGDLNHVILNAYHGTTPLHGSLNPSERLDLVRHIPQHHWCGSEDKVVPCWTVAAFCEQCDNPEIVHCSEFKGASHHKKWEKAWPMLLAEMHLSKLDSP